MFAVLFVIGIALFFATVFGATEYVFGGVGVLVALVIAAVLIMVALVGVGG